MNSQLAAEPCSEWVEVVPPNELRCGGQSTTVQPIPWLLIDYLTKNVSAGEKEQTIIDIVWGGIDAEEKDSDNAVKMAVKKANQALEKIGASVRIYRKNGYVMLLNEDFSKN